MPLIADLPPDKVTPARLWSRLDPETQRLAAGALFDPEWKDGSGRAEALHAIAAALRFRDQAVLQLPVAKRIDYLVRRVHPDESLAGTLLTALHLVRRKAVLAAFLDDLGIPQKDGVIAEGHEVALPDPPRIAAAVDALFAAFPAADVELYLATLVALDPGVWGPLDPVLRERTA
jgi:hypothetical protein